MSAKTESVKVNFIKNIIEEDLASGKHQSIATRFPPEPNGYLHIGHAKAICLNFGLAEDFNGTCNLRFDDTNPEKEDQEFVDAIIEDVSWLGFKWNALHHASDYYEVLYNHAVELIKMSKAFVCDLNAEEMREYRGTLKEPGKNSPFRDRSIEENLELFEKMRAGEFANGEKSLRAKIDMAAGNINLRDPVIYRIKKVPHQRTGDTWCIYPMYDYAHCLSDAQEHITHSLCTLEFEDHRPLYDWFIEVLKTPAKPRQIESAPLGLTHTMMSKRNLRLLVEKELVSGWDDPRMPTLSGFRRRGYTPNSIKNFCRDLGVGKKTTTIDLSILEDAIRNDLNETAPRSMTVLDPIPVTITNWEEGRVERLRAPIHPQNPDMGERDVEFSGEVYIDREDFLEEPPAKFFRLGPDREVRLRFGYVIKCTSFEKDEAGRVTRILATYDPDTLGKKPEGRKVKGIVHWVAAHSAINAEVRVYDRLFLSEKPQAETFLDDINPDSLKVWKNAKCTPDTAEVEPGQSFQFERLGYFTADSKDHQASRPTFNRTVTLRDGWAKKSK